MGAEVDTAALRAQLRHVYWIGGGSGAGKSVIARRLAARHGLRLYATDDAMADHGKRIRREDLGLRAIDVDATANADDLVTRVADALGISGRRPAGRS